VLFELRVELRAMPKMRAASGRPIASHTESIAALEPTRVRLFSWVVCGAAAAAPIAVSPLTTIMAGTTRRS
jgi:hypothetical protein